MTFPLLTNNQTPSNELIALINDVSVVKQHHTIQAYFQKNNLNYNPKDLKILSDNLESLCQKLLTYAACAKYAVMQKTQEWGAAGQEQVQTSFARCLLQLPPDVELTHANFESFQETFDTTFQEMGGNRLSLQALQEFYNTFNFPIFGKTYKNSQWQELTDILQFLGSKKGYLMTSFGQDAQFIYGDIKVKTIGLHKVTYFLTETIRSPNVIVPKVAMSQDAEVFIRYEGLKAIFHQKWVPVFSEENKWGLSSPERNISEAIKRKTLHLYEVTTPEETKTIEKQFVQDMCETIVYHELGHIISRHDILDEKIAAITEGSQVLGYAIPLALFELLADFAPTMHNIKGPLQNMVDISKKDEKRATAMFYMYFSDVWFFDTYDTYMYIYSDLMALVLLRYVKDDQTINFKKLEHDIYFKKSESDSDKDKTRFVNFLYDSLTTLTTKLQSQVKKAKFHIEHKPRTFEQIQAMIELMFAYNGSKYEEHDYFYISSLWGFLIKAVQKQSYSQNALQIFLEQEKNAIIKKLFLALAGAESVKQNKDQHRQFIFAKMQKMGFKVATH